MKKYQYYITGDLVDKKGYKTPFAEHVFLYRSKDIPAARKKVSDKYRGAGYNVKIYTASEVAPQTDNS